MNRREWVRVAAGAVAAAAGAAQRSRPNILFLFADDQRFDTIGALGNRAIATPNLDSLVKRGISFTNTFIMGSTIPAVCSPSRAMLLSGQDLFHAGPITMPPQPTGADRTFDLWPEVLSQGRIQDMDDGQMA
jgi:arylsulfatase A-like enzyme